MLTPDSSRFWPADALRAGHARSPPSTSSTCATGSTRPAGTTRRRRPSCRPTWSSRHARQVRRGLRADHGALALLSEPKARVADPARRRGSSTPRARRSSGRCRRSASRGSRTSGSAAWSSSRPRTRRELGRALREAAREPADRGLRDRALDERRVMRSCRRRSSSPAPATSATPLRACCSGSARRGWSGTSDRDLDGVDAVVVPGGFSYGDYLRAGRDRPLLAGDGGGGRVRRRRAARCSGSATASRCSARPGCCPAPCCRNDALRSSAARSTLDVRADRRRRWHTRVCEPASRCRSRSSTARALLRARTMLDALEAPGRSSSATRRATNPNGSARATSPGVAQRGAATWSG